jgi:hypothetical protein
MGTAAFSESVDAEMGEAYLLGDLLLCMPLSNLIHLTGKSLCCCLELGAGVHKQRLFSFQLLRIDA